jgi:Arm DNA-binding domain
MALTMKKVAALRRRPGRYGDGQNLVLQVISESNTSWLFCYERNGRAHQMGLGPLHTVNLREARELARAARQLLLAGIDPPGTQARRARPARGRGGSERHFQDLHRALLRCAC